MRPLDMPRLTRPRKRHSNADIEKRLCRPSRRSSKSVTPRTTESVNHKSANYNQAADPTSEMHYLATVHEHLLLYPSMFLKLSYLIYVFYLKFLCNFSFEYSHWLHQFLIYYIQWYVLKIFNTNHFRYQNLRNFYMYIEKYLIIIHFCSSIKGSLGMSVHVRRTNTSRSISHRVITESPDD